eukprot:m51a1_g3046 hypothetical protein (209) ;mRNA; f:944077-944922
MLSCCQRERCSSTASSLLYSKGFILMNFVIIVLNFTVMIWMVLEAIRKDYTELQSTGMYAIEIIITACLLAEIGIRMTSMGPHKYFTTCSNLLDFSVMLFSVVNLVTSRLVPYFAGHLDNVAVILLLGSRYLAQQLRLIIALKNQHRNFDAQSMVIDTSTPSKAEQGETEGADADIGENPFDSDSESDEADPLTAERSRLVGHDPQSP